MQGVRNADSTTAVDEVNLNIPNGFLLEQNYPNPFNPTTIINYNLREHGLVRLKIFDSLGREVATLVNKIQSAGSHTIEFDAAGINLASGTYIYQVDSGGFIQSRKMIFIR